MMTSTNGPERFDVLVVGGGPAGLAAAASAAASGVRVALVDNGPALGGQIWRRGVSPTAARAARPWLERLDERGVTRVVGAEVVDVFRPSKRRYGLLLQTPEGSRALAGKKLILATGAVERFLPFPGWTLPGVLGAGALQAMAKSGFDLDGRRVVVAGTGPLLLAVAALARSHGARVLLVAEQASWRALRQFSPCLVSHPRKLVQAIDLRLRLLGVPYRTSTWPVRAEAGRAEAGRAEAGREGSTSGDSLGRVVLRGPDGETSLDCDLLACGFGLLPETRLARRLGCAVADGRVVVDSAQRTSVDKVLAAGEITGVAGVDAAVVEGRVAGYVATGQASRARGLLARRDRDRRFAARLDRAFSPRAELRELPAGDTIVCRCEDVPWSAVREHEDPRACKLATRCGMGACQSRVCGAALDFLLGWAPEPVRPPLFPADLDVLAHVDS